MTPSRLLSGATSGHTERVARTDTQIVECGPEADIVETPVNHIAIAIASVSQSDDAADRGVGELVLFVAVGAADVRRPARAVIEETGAEKCEATDVVGILVCPGIQSGVGRRGVRSAEAIPGRVVRDKRRLVELDGKPEEE